MVGFDEIGAAFAGTGIVARGGFRVEPNDGAPRLEDGRHAVALVLLGNVGGSVWNAFDAAAATGDEPLDDWVRGVVDPVAVRLGARAVHPNDRPYAPFQRWALRAEAVHPSPLGLLIHPEYGLWHAYRAALVFAAPVVGLPVRADAPSPCAVCVEKPCLAACPVAAFNGALFDVDACATHLRRAAPPDCLQQGCQARDACPVGRNWRYGEAQVRFHMQAFFRARG